MLNEIFLVIFKHFSNLFAEVQTIKISLTFFREQSKKKIGRQMELAGSNLTEDQLEDMLDKGEGAQLVGHVHIEGDADQLRQTINDIENRHEMFISLEKSITELHDMFIDIATLIESQGEMVNRIGKKNRARGNRKTLQRPKSMSKINLRNLILKSHEEYLICGTYFVKQKTWFSS